MMRRPRPLERKNGTVRDATLVVIASEDKYAVKQYFDFFRSTRIQFRVIETDDGKSAPAHVLDRLEAYKREYDFGDGDEFWLVLDCDHWTKPGHVKNLREVVKQCGEKGIKVALSSPCFDLWLLLHFLDCPEGDAIRCDEIGQRIRDEVGSYNKLKVYNLPITDERVREAVERAAQNELQPNKIPNGGLRTAVHHIMKDLVERNVISIVSLPSTE